MSRFFKLGVCYYTVSYYFSVSQAILTNNKPVFSNLNFFLNYLIKQEKTCKFLCSKILKFPNAIKSGHPIHSNHPPSFVNGITDDLLNKDTHQSVLAQLLLLPIHLHTITPVNQQSECSTQKNRRTENHMDGRRLNTINWQ